MTSTDADERADLLAELAQARHWLVFPTRDLTDEQAASRPTQSQLTLGGLIKHVAKVEEGWMRFAVEGASAEEGFELPEGMTIDDFEGWIASLDEKPAWLVERENEFKLLPDETLAGVVAHYQEVAGAHRGDAGVAAGPQRPPRAAEGAVARAGIVVVGAPGDAPHHRRDDAARRPRRHAPRAHRRRDIHVSYPSVVLGHGPGAIMPGVTEQAGAQRTQGGTDTDDQESAAGGESTGTASSTADQGASPTASSDSGSSSDEGSSSTGSAESKGSDDTRQSQDSDGSRPAAVPAAGLRQQDQDSEQQGQQKSTEVRRSRAGPAAEVRAAGPAAVPRLRADRRRRGPARPRRARPAERRRDDLEDGERPRDRRAGDRLRPRRRAPRVDRADDRRGQRRQRRRAVHRRRRRHRGARLPRPLRARGPDLRLRRELRPGGDLLDPRRGVRRPPGALDRARA